MAGHIAQLIHDVALSGDPRPVGIARGTFHSKVMGMIDQTAEIPGYDQLARMLNAQDCGAVFEAVEAYRTDTPQEVRDNLVDRELVTNYLLGWDVVDRPTAIGIGSIIRPSQVRGLFDALETILSADIPQAQKIQEVSDYIFPWAERFLDELDIELD